MGKKELEKQALAALRNRHVGIAATAAKTAHAGQPRFETSHKFATAGLCHCHRGAFLVSLDVLEPFVGLVHASESNYYGIKLIVKGGMWRSRSDPERPTPSSEAGIGLLRARPFEI